MIDTKTPVEEFVDTLTLAIDNDDMLGHVERIAARDAVFGAPRRAKLHPRVLDALVSRGVQRMYSHQAEAIDAALTGENVVVSTSTASGKSVCYHTPVMQMLLDDPDATALYLFPTKALAHDQIAGLSEMLDGSGIDIRCDTYDGDTPKADRAAIRAKSRIIITNVDMLHLSLLQAHGGWKRFLSNLKVVVVDEAHYYRGLFGSHVSMLMRRLRRVLAFYGADPQFVLCSATIANPAEHATNLTGKRFRVIDIDGSPAGERAFVLLDMVSAEENYGATGVNMQAAMFTATLMKRDVKTLAFAQNRQGVERIVQYVNEMLIGRRAGRNARPDLEGRIRPYRAGYMAEERREVEQGLRDGELLAVASTNAMELGIDIGNIDATVISGFPGTIASAWQQAGRSGRRGELSLSLMLMRDNAVDQFYRRFPKAFFAAAHESAVTSLTNEVILAAHLQCAAGEIPLSREDFDLFGEGSVRKVSQQLVKEGKLEIGRDNRRRLPRGAAPWFGVNIRSSDMERYNLINSASGRKMEETTRSYALRELYPGAVYSHRGTTYRVVSFDEKGGQAELRYLNERIFTQPCIDTEINIITENEQPIRVGGLTIRSGTVNVKEQVTGFYEKGLYSRDEGTYHPVEMPALEFETVAVWFCGREPVARYDDQPALHAAAHVGAGALATLTMCDKRDVSGVALPGHPQLGTDATFIYENEVGGVGLVEFIERRPQVFVDRMIEMVESCRCDEGCPSCIESAYCMDDVPADPSKAGLVAYLRQRGG